MFTFTCFDFCLFWYVPNRQSLTEGGGERGGVKCVPVEPKLESKRIKRPQSIPLPLRAPLHLRAPPAPQGPPSAHTLPPPVCVFALNVSLWAHFYLPFIMCVLIPYWLVTDNGPRSQRGVCLMCVEGSCLCPSTCAEVKGQFFGNRFSSSKPVGFRDPIHAVSLDGQVLRRTEPSRQPGKQTFI